MKNIKLKLLLTICLFSVFACQENNSNNSTSSYSSENVFSNDFNSSQEHTKTSIGIKSHDIVSKDEVSSSNITSKDSSSINNTSSSQKTSSSNISFNSSISKDYEALLTPSNINNPIDISDWQNFSFIDYLPSDFYYIYGNNKVTPDIYADGGGLVMDKNDGPRKGLQTPCFNTWNKIELRIQLGKFHGTNKSQNKNDPVFTIDCFSKAGSLIDTYYIDEINVTDNSEVKTYIRNSSVCYLEIRATNLPIKSNKVYNFGISGISLKGWIYD